MHDLLTHARITSSTFSLWRFIPSIVSIFNFYLSFTLVILLFFYLIWFYFWFYLSIDYNFVNFFYLSDVLKITQKMKMSALYVHLKTGENDFVSLLSVHDIKLKITKYYFCDRFRMFIESFFVKSWCAIFNLNKIWAPLDRVELHFYVSFAAFPLLQHYINSHLQRFIVANCHWHIFTRKVLDIIKAQEHNKDLHEQFHHQVCIVISS